MINYLVNYKTRKGVDATAVTASQGMPAGQLSVRTMASCYNCCAHSLPGPHYLSYLLMQKCLSYLLMQKCLFTAQCTRYCYRKLYVRPSVCLSVTLLYRGHIGWSSSKVITRIISLGLCSSEPQHRQSSSKGWNSGGIGVWSLFSGNLQYL